MSRMLRLLAPVGLAGVLLLADAAVVAEQAGAPNGVGRQEDAEPGALASGRILVATRQVRDATFERSIVLLFSRSDEGTAGLILNRPAPFSVERVLPDLPRPEGPDSRTFFGGPVSIDQVRGLLRTAVAPVDARQLLPGVYLLPTSDALRSAVAEGRTTGQMRLFYGYAGWGPGQLEHEIRRGDWHVIDGDASVIFDPAPETIWFRRIRASDTIAA